MEAPTVGIVLSTTREGRFGERPASWILRIASERGDLSAEIVDLRDYPMPFFQESKAPIYGEPSSNAAVRAWSEKVESLDALIFVTAEYNRGPPGVLKNALDSAYVEFGRKPAAFVGYGGVGGARAVEQLRLWCIELQMACTRNAVHIGGADFLKAYRDGVELDDLPNLNESAIKMLDELSWWAGVLKAARV